MAVNLFIGTNWGTASNWSLGSIPAASDGHVATFGSTSSNCTLGAARACDSIDFTNYTNTIAMSTFAITASGNITLGAGMGQSGTGGIVSSFTVNTVTITSNGKTWPTTFTIAGASGTASISGTWSNTGLVTTGGSVGTKWITGSPIVCSAAYTHGTTTTHIVDGTAKIILAGAGVWTCTGVLRLPVELRSTGTYTNNGTMNYNTGTLTLTSGTFSAGVLNNLVSAASTTWDTDRGSGASMSFYRMALIGTHTLTTNLNVVDRITINGTGQFDGAGKINNNWTIPNFYLTPGAVATWTLTNDFICTNFYPNQATSALTLNGYNLYVSGNVSPIGTGALSGTTNIIYNGSGTWNATGAGVIKNNVTINTAGTLNLGNFNFNTGTFTYTAGTINSTGTFSMILDTILDTNDILLANVSIGATSQISLLSGFRMNGLLSTTGITATTVTTHMKLKSSSPGTQRTVVLCPACITSRQDILYLDATDIDSSLGETIWTFRGVLSNATNWRVLSTPTTISSIF